MIFATQFKVMMSSFIVRILYFLLNTVFEELLLIAESPYNLFSLLEYRVETMEYQKRFSGS